MKMNKRYFCFLFIFSFFIINVFCQNNDIITNSVNDFVNNKLQKFDSNDYKNKGISFTMNYPSNYSSKDGTRPHILK